MTPLEYYQDHCKRGLISEDPEQLLVLQKIQQIYQNVIAEHQVRSSLMAFLRKPKLVNGLYLWGGVGVGKTFLMDCLYHCIPFKEKKRIHFHPFMRWVHQELKAHQGEKNPLEVIARDFAKNTTLLCFDEFFVTDITDAMILARLLKALFANGVCLVATSNSVPDDLYKNGLQRKLFLPAISMLKQYTEVVHIPTTIDYRLRHLKHAGVFYVTDDEGTEDNMEKDFAVLTNGTQESADPVIICDRSVAIKKQAADVIWFDFDVICNVPRSQHDYLAIADKYTTVFISGIPIIEPEARNTISLFIRLVDVFYDRRIRLIFSAADTVDRIYIHGFMLPEFTRTRSRLLEMQSEDYVANRL